MALSKQKQVTAKNNHAKQKQNKHELQVLTDLTLHLLPAELQLERAEKKRKDEHERWWALFEMKYGTYEDPDLPSAPPEPKPRKKRTLTHGLLRSWPPHHDSPIRGGRACTHRHTRLLNLGPLGCQP